jgi:hypothetical protein
MIHVNTWLLGLKVKDKVTGFTGIVTSICIDLYGCVQALVHPGLDKDGAVRDQSWLDIDRLEIIDENPVMTPPAVVLEPKGPAQKPRFTKV